MLRRAVVFFLSAFLATGAARADARGDAARGSAKAADCASCHGTSERPPLPGMPTLAGQQAEFLVLQMFLMREGVREVPQMPGMLKGFSDRDLEDVAAYFAAERRLPGGGKRDPQLYARGEALAQAMACASCHLKDYRGQRQVPRVSGQREDYLAATLQAYRDDRRAGADTNMNGLMYKVPDSDIRALAHYLAQVASE